MLRHTLSGAIFAFIAVSCAQASSISLTNDFSLTNGNPNGQWAYLVGATLGTATPLSFEIPQQNGNAVIPAVADGYWSTGNNLNTNTPDFAKALVDGSDAGETDEDFLAGDIIGHSPNQSGTALWLTWTAPSAGTISGLDFDIWYAHSAAGARSNFFELLDDDTTLVSGTVSSTSFYNRDNADSYSNVGGFSVAQGDTITIGIAKSAGEQFGSLDGMALDFTFTSSAPEPSSIFLVCSGLAMLCYFRRRSYSRV